MTAPRLNQHPLKSKFSTLNAQRYVTESKVTLLAGARW
jgi:hypothetical protein